MAHSHARARALAAAVFFTIAASSFSAATAPDSSFRCFDSIVSFGDSLSDTGNDLFPGLHQGPCLAANPPYGRTYFHRPTGRLSDGRLVVDFIAQSIGLPLLKPYFSEAHQKAAQRRRSFSTGVNFAAAGSAVLPYEFYEKIGYQNPWATDGRKYLEKCLVVLGPLGGNDYNHLFLQGMTLDKVQLVAPLVVTRIGSTIQELIKLGAATILVPGSLPDGCMPISLTIHEKSSTPNDYDPQNGCLRWMNQFCRHHNHLLQEELQRIRELHPHVNIMYADYYNATMRMHLSPNQFGFGSQILRSCCGGGGTYNYDPDKRCGTPQAKCCRDPAEYISWDGVHFMEAANGLIAQGLLQGLYTDPPFSTICLINSTAKPRAIAEY
ncbi:GDSL esterase/lipase At1g31550-like [Andrographis paniculata]|uniref:GDSL esterase/lipase At1g31550-like n=1 Tax=Andrographis paniculata TaxID=175694 RepID=UPI0021E8B1BC|nr:GDSL esterase/lipase At1g31550-like [Andrographis paniculata]